MSIRDEWIKKMVHTKEFCSGWTWGVCRGMDRQIIIFSKIRESQEDKAGTQEDYAKLHLYSEDSESPGYITRLRVTAWERGLQLNCLYQIGPHVCEEFSWLVTDMGWPSQLDCASPGQMVLPGVVSRLSKPVSSIPACPLHYSLPPAFCL